VCGTCDQIHYQNPKIVVGCLAEWESKILLCKRAIEPAYGLWTLPAGFMENNETTLEGAMRETLEEANARVRILDLYALFNLPHVNQVYMMFRAKLLDLNYMPGAESLEVKLFDKHEIPWSELAFRTVPQTLKHYYEDREKGQFSLHIGDILPAQSG
jgi:ADP-ribose pyrophosphatase YjhB (NUDIX family)